MIRPRTVIIILILCLSTGFFGLALLRKTCDREKKAKCYRDQLAFNLRVAQNIPDHAVVFVGDSLVRGLCVAAVAPYAVNLGIGRDTTEGVLKRLGDYRTLSRARAVVLLVGVNDLIQRRKKGITGRYEAILKEIPGNVAIVFNALMPVDERATNKVCNRDILLLNKVMKQACSEQANCRFFDLTEKLIDFSGNLRPQYHIGDGIHLNAKGYGILIENMKSLVKHI